ncbi:MAG TPA: CGNR zinc finger domain-containing protein [Longimicrobiales bacterium]|nr:CGNR zinc finger domain-containing protein [Longimicrobiales bacterium]
MASQSEAERSESFRAPPNGKGPDHALDLVNTLGPVEGSAGDRLQTPEQLLTWLSARGLGRERLEALRASPAEAAVLLREARRLRDDVARAFDALRERRDVPPEAAYGIDRVLAERSVAIRLRGEGAGLRLEEEPRSPSLAALLAPLARSAAELITGSDPRRLRRCAAADCNAWFVDTSKGGRRRWCSMATCGNRAKAARHRRRQRAG